MKKILAMVISIALVATMAITGSIAYLQDTDGAINTMTMGNVFIEQYEQQRVKGADGKYTDELQEFKQGQQMVPAVYNAENVEDDDYSSKMPVKVGDHTVEIRDEVKNYIDKIVTVENTGNANAYVRTIFAFPEAGDFDTTYDASEQWFHWNGVSDGDTSIPNGWMWGRNKSEWPANTDNWDVVENVEITIDGVTSKYDIYVATNKNIIKGGETTAPNLLGFFVDKTVDNEMDADGKLYYTFPGKDAGGNDKLYNLGDISKLNVLVLSQAVQAEGFADAWTALDEAFGDVDATNVQKWFGELEAPAVISATNKTDLKTNIKEALEDGAKDVVVDADGAEMGDLNYGLSTDMVPEGSTVTIRNAHFTGKSYGNAVNGTVIFDNCTFDRAGGAYSIHFDAGKGNVIFNNCKLYGWCSFGTAIQSVEMNNCQLYGNGDYAMYRFYQDTTLTNCTIDCSNAPHDDSWADGISAVEGATVQLKNCNVVYADYEVEGNAKIVVDGTTVA